MKDNIKSEVQRLLKEDITVFELKGVGFVNNAYYIETEQGGKYIVKEEKEVQEFQPQNDLVVEAKVAQALHGLDLSIPIPEVVLVSENPEMYGYRYVDGDILINVWKDFSEEEKIDTFKTLGYFHAEIGQQISKEKAKDIGVNIDESTGLHPEVLEEYEGIITDGSLPEDIKNLAKKAKTIFDTTLSQVVFQFLHNDSHHENILVKNRKIVGFIDFGNSEYGEVAKEFSRYIRDFPDYFKHIVYAYEEKSGNDLSYARLVTNSFLSGLIDNVENYKKGGEDRINAEKSIGAYREMIDSL